MSRDLLHIPVVVKGWDPAGVACWRVFCEACSGEISDYVSECKQKLGDDWPPPCLYDTHPLDDVKANETPGGGGVGDFLADETGSPSPGQDPWCDWCGRAIYQAKMQRSGLRWFAVKGVERGYDPLLCDANPEDGRHEPATAAKANYSEVRDDD